MNEITKLYDEALLNKANDYRKIITNLEILYDNIKSQKSNGDEIIIPKLGILPIEVKYDLIKLLVDLNVLVYIDRDILINDIEITSISDKAFNQLCESISSHINYYSSIINTVYNTSKRNDNKGPRYNNLYYFKI